MWAKQFQPAAALAYRNAAKPALVLSHNPDTADEPGWLGYEGWILSGHTHGGQCKPPFLPPPVIPVRNKRYTSGEIGTSLNVKVATVKTRVYRGRAGVRAALGG